MDRIIVVTGTPGTGKTVLAKSISKKHGHGYIDVNEVVKRYGLSEGYDLKRKTRIVDEMKLAKVLEKVIREARKRKGKLVIDSHMSHFVDPKSVDLCIVTKCGLKELERRLKRKGYHKAKIEDNIQAEIFDICYAEALERGHNIKIVWTDK